MSKLFKPICYSLTAVLLLQIYAVNESFAQPQLTDTDQPTIQVSVIQPGNPQCSNGLDDDLDGFIDLADPDCIDGSDNVEQGESSDSSSGSVSSELASQFPPGVQIPRQILFSGQTFSDARVSVLRGGIIIAQTEANSDGEFSIQLLEEPIGTYIYTIQARLQNGLYSLPQSVPLENVAFKVIEVANIELLSIREEIRGDLNEDNAVDIRDLSVATYWINKPLFGKILDFESRLLNNDGKIDLFDISIIVYYWTGQI